MQVAALDAQDCEGNTEEYMGQEENDAEERSESENIEPHHVEDKTSYETEETCVNGVENKQNGTRRERNDASEDANGVSPKENSELEANDTENISDVAQKREVRQRKMQSFF